MNDPLQNEVTVYLQKDIFYVCPNVFCLDIPTNPLFQKLHFPIEIILVFGHSLDMYAEHSENGSRIRSLPSQQFARLV